MHSAWWTPLVQGSWGVAMGLVMAWLARGRLQPRPASESRQMMHSRTMLFLGIFVVLFWIVMVIVCFFTEKEDDRLWYVAAFLAIGALSSWFLWEYRFTRHEVSEVGMNYATLFRGRGSFRWQDVESVRFSNINKWFKIRLRSGRPVRISGWLMGLPTFATLLLQHVDHNAID